jgi:hypothetical protein
VGFPDSVGKSALQLATASSLGILPTSNFIQLALGLSMYKILGHFSGIFPEIFAFASSFGFALIFAAKQLRKMLLDVSL